MFFRETRWPDEYQNSNWDTGTDKTYLKGAVGIPGVRLRLARAGSKTELSNAVRGKDWNNDIHFVHAVPSLAS
jgi:hypothetical protein